MFKKTMISVVMFLGVTLLVGCSSNEDIWQRTLEKYAAEADTKLSRLEKHLKAGHVGNAALLTVYAKRIKSVKPDYADIADMLAKDATVDGPIYRGLESRLMDARNDIPKSVAAGKEQAAALLREFKSINAAASLEVYGMMLTDPINVLADMSDGQLGRVQALKKEASLAQNNVEDMGAGSQLVGNPSYGRWQTHSSGSSYWAFYGQYRLFSDLFGRPVYYSRWSSNRDYSYYHDRGRDYYTSPKQRQSQNTAEKKARKKFASSGKKFTSPYAKQRTGPSMPKRNVVKSPSKFNSSSSGYQSSYNKQSTKSWGGSQQKSTSSWGGSYNSRGTSGSYRGMGGGK